MRLFRIYRASSPLDADETIKEEEEFTALDKTDEWNWDDEGDNVRPTQSRKVVADVIEQAKEGNLQKFHEHFLKDFVVPDSHASDGENLDVRNCSCVITLSPTQNN